MGLTWLLRLPPKTAMASLLPTEHAAWPERGKGLLPVVRGRDHAYVCRDTDQHEGEHTLLQSQKTPRLRHGAAYRHIEDIHI